MLAGELYVNQPFYCDYGKNYIFIGAGSVVTHDLAARHNLNLLDAPIGTIVKF